MIIWDTVCIRFFKWQIDFSKGVIFRIDCVAFLMCCMRPFDSVKKFLKTNAIKWPRTTRWNSNARKRRGSVFVITRPSDLLRYQCVKLERNESDARAMRILPGFFVRCCSYVLYEAT